MLKLFYNEDNLYRIYHGNNRDLTKMLPDKSIPLVFADPPYGIGFEYDSPFEDTWEYYKENVAFLLNDVLPKAKVMVVTPGGYTSVQYWYDQMKPKWRICWYKGAVGHRSKVGFAHWEEVLIYSNGEDTIYGNIPDFIHATPEQNKEGHACPKPEKLIMFFISAYTKVGELVYDPFLGGGTTLVSAKILNRKGLGCELSEKYCQIAAKRVSQEISMPGVIVKNLHQEVLFGEDDTDNN